MILFLILLVFFIVFTPFVEFVLFVLLLTVLVLRLNKFFIVISPFGVMWFCFVSFTVTTVYQVDLCNFFANLCGFQKSFIFFLSVNFRGLCVWAFLFDCGYSIAARPLQLLC
ncbi:hypothetical protein, partial [Ruminococcus sp.]|uniref:hypothetical protein n=1 Tax=Ruminococcus sp. TaxID=41978 RepID=UPI003869C822